MTREQPTHDSKAPDAPEWTDEMAEAAVSFRDLPQSLQDKLRGLRKPSNPQDAPTPPAL